MVKAKKKLILTHLGNLRAKYQHQNLQPSQNDITQMEDDLARLASKLDEWIAFDRTRNIQTEVIYLDTDPRLGEKRVTDPAWPEGFKKAVDEAYNQLHPAYLLILGGSDIVPFIPLRDPCMPYSMQGSSLDAANLDTIPSDLPYACDQACDIADPDTYRVTAFLNPTRAVSRCPDVNGDASMGIQVLLRTLDYIMQLVPHTAAHYRTPWAVCTPVRQTPIARILEMMYGYLGTPTSNVCAPHPDLWDMVQYHSTVHLHIVHGDKQTNLLYGEDPDAPDPYPTAIHSDWVDGNVTPGTVVLELACYGGQLYDPRQGISNRSPLVNMYLSSGAACMTASTVPTFSDPDGVLLGDYLLAKFFEFLNGRTVGEAFLMTRKWLMGSDYPNRLCNEDLHMYAAFQLYGDVSATPISNAPFYAPIEDDRNPDSGRLPSTNPDGIGTAQELVQSGDFQPPEEDEGQILYPLEADEKLKVPKEVEAAIQAYLEKKYQVKSIDFIICSQLMQHGEIVKDRMQFTAYTKDVGTLETVDTKNAVSGCDPGSNKERNRIGSGKQGESGRDQKETRKQTAVETDKNGNVPIHQTGNGMKRPAEIGARFIFQSPGKTPEEPVEFLFGCTAN